MGTRGRRSAESRIATLMPNVETIQRPEPPYELTDEQADEWRAICNRLPADWFPRETHAVLAQYCRHIVAARRIAQLVAQLEGGSKLDIAEYDQLLKMQDREGRALSSLATRMRLTAQAVARPSAAGKARRVVSQPPWQSEDT